jgi:hypothetical protein
MAMVIATLSMKGRERGVKDKRQNGTGNLQRNIAIRSLPFHPPAPELPSFLLNSHQSLQKKTCARSLLALAALVTTTLSAPTPSNGVNFPITDLVGSDLTIDEYAAQ